MSVRGPLAAVSLTERIPDDTERTPVREYIAAGDTYQVNYTVRGRFETDGGGAERDGTDRGCNRPFDYFCPAGPQQVP